MPHPHKVHKGGEGAPTAPQLAHKSDHTSFLKHADPPPSSHAADACFGCGSAAGVADGVGGWAESGVDPGLYSKQLMHFARKCALALPLAHVNICSNGNIGQAGNGVVLV